MSEQIRDEALPAVEALLGDEGQAMIRALAADSSLSDIRRAQVRYVPGRSITIQFTATVESGREVMISACSGLDVPDGLPQVEVESAEGTSGAISFWRFPEDPFLPGLAAANDPDRVRGLLRSIGAPHEGPIRLRTRAYRAGRRAVVEVAAPRTRIFLKVVRPQRTESLQAHHVALAGSVPVPHSLGWSAELGIVVLEAMPGVTLRSAVESSAPLPGGDVLIRLLDALQVPPDSRRVPGAEERVADHGRLLRAILPTASVRIDEMISRIGSGEDEPGVAAHGDFHLGQVLVDDGAVVGLVDVDTAGIGTRVDDLAQMLGHAAVVESISRRPGAIREYGASLAASFDRHVSRSGLRRKVAAAVFGLATGPFRVQESGWRVGTMQRLETVERWLDSADDAAD